MAAVQLGLRCTDMQGMAVVELAAWEQDKENVRPLRRGRDPAILAQAICMPRKADASPQVVDGGAPVFEDERQQRRQAFEAKITELTSTRPSEDQLPAVVERVVQLWYNFAQWAGQWYPRDPKEERAVLERATQALASEPSCREDERYLRLWLRLADLHKEPQEIFNFLWSNNVGETHAAFYEAWARSLERQRRFGEAEEAVGVGIARNAQPVERLVSYQRSLAARMQQRIRQSVEAAVDGTLPQFTAGVGELSRPVFNSLTIEEASQLQRPCERRREQPQSLGLGATVVPGLPSLICLDEFPEARSSIFDATSAWLHPPLGESIVEKENLQVATGRVTRAAPGRRRAPWQTTSAAVGTSDFAVFVDPEFQAADPRPSAVTATAMSVPAASPGYASVRQSVSSSARPRPWAKEPAAAANRSLGGRMKEDPLGKDLRRSRPWDTAVGAEAASALADSLSGLSLGDGPPPKRACVASSPSLPVCLGDLDIPMQPQVAEPAPQTPPRRPRHGYAELGGTVDEDPPPIRRQQSPLGTAQESSSESPGLRPQRVEVMLLSPILRSPERLFVS